MSTVPKQFWCKAPNCKKMRNRYGLCVDHDPNMRCRFTFKSLSCGYKGRARVCNKTASRCRELHNFVRFGATIL